MSITRQKMLRLKFQLYEQEQLHAIELERLKREMRVLQHTCPHDSVTYYGDPTGGSDGFDRCNDCDAVVS